MRLDSKIGIEIRALRTKIPVILPPQLFLAWALSHVQSLTSQALHKAKQHNPKPGRGVTCVFFFGVTCVFFLGVAFVFSAGSEATVSNERPPGGASLPAARGLEQSCGKRSSDALYAHTWLRIYINIHKCKGN